MLPHIIISSNNVVMLINTQLQGKAEKSSVRYSYFTMPLLHFHLCGTFKQQLKQEIDMYRCCSLITADNSALYNCSLSPVLELGRELKS